MNIFSHIDCYNLNKKNKTVNLTLNNWYYYLNVNTYVSVCTADHFGPNINRHFNFKLFKKKETCVIILK